MTEDATTEEGTNTALENLADALSDDSYSTAFSGIDAPVVSMRQIAHSLRRRLPHRMIKQPTVLYNIEWLEDSQAELLMMPGSDACLFGDIASFYAQPIKNIIPGAALPHSKHLSPCCF